MPWLGGDSGYALVEFDEEECASSDSVEISDSRGSLPTFEGRRLMLESSLVGL